MEKKGLLTFCFGVVISYLVFFYIMFDAGNQDSASYMLVDKKFFSEINETRIVEYDNFSVSFSVVNYWTVADFHPVSGLTALPYLVNFSIVNKVDSIQWVDSVSEYYQVYVYNETGVVGRTILVNDSSVDVMGVFLAPLGRHEVSSLWYGKVGGNRLPDGVYEFKVFSVVEGEEIVFDCMVFTVETKQVKIRKNLVS